MAGRTFYIYCHTAPNGKRYIGQTRLKPEKRWNNGHGYDTQQHFKRAIDKYGWDNFEHVVLCSVSSKEYADFLEQWFISRWDTCNPDKGYNCAKGGAGPTGVTWDDERKQAFSEYMSGENNPMYGKHHSPETIALMSKNRSGKFISPEMREFRTGVLLKANKDRQIPVRQLDLDGNLIATYAGVSEAEKATGFNHAGIWNTCRGNTDKAYGYRWEYVDDELRHEAELRRDTRPTGGTAVIQYSLDGTEFARFKSLSVAERETGINRDGISDCCHRGYESYGGYVWRFADESKVKADETAVVQFDKHGDRVAEYGSIAEASAQTGVPRYLIRRCCRGVKKSAGGFKWEFLDSAMKDSPAIVRMGVIQLDLNGNEIARFASLTEAMRATGYDRHRISECCQGKRESYRSYRWQYINAKNYQPASGLFS